MPRPLPVFAPLVLVVIVVTTLFTRPACAQAPPIQGRGVCLTQWGWCPLAFPERTPVNAPCYCLLPGNRFISGATAADFYYGTAMPPYLVPYPDGRPPWEGPPSVIK